MPSASRKYSATVSADIPTRSRAPDGSVICRRPARRAISCVLRVDDAAFLELVPEVVALARAFADATNTRRRRASARCCDQLHDDDVADAGAAEQPVLPPEGSVEQVDDLDAGLEIFRSSMVLEAWRAR